MCPITTLKTAHVPPTFRFFLFLATCLLCEYPLTKTLKPCLAKGRSIWFPNQAGRRRWSFPFFFFLRSPRRSSSEDNLINKGHSLLESLFVFACLSLQSKVLIEKRINYLLQTMEWLPSGCVIDLQQWSRPYHHRAHHSCFWMIVEKLD